MNGHRKQTFHLVGSPLLLLKVFSQTGHSGTARMTVTWAMYGHTCEVAENLHKVWRSF